MPPRVLVVDNDASLTAALRRQARSADIEVVFSEDALGALRLATTASYDAVVADEGLPRLRGTVLLDQLRKKKPDVALVLMTAVDDRRLLSKVLDIGLDAAVAKPFEPCDLWRAVEKAIRRRLEASRLSALARAASVYTSDSNTLACVHCPLPPDIVDRFTPAQHRVIDAMYAGERVECIADRLTCSESTIRDHLSAAYGRAGLRKGLGWTELVRRFPWKT